MAIHFQVRVGWDSGSLGETPEEHHAMRHPVSDVHTEWDNHGSTCTTLNDTLTGRPALFRQEIVRSETND